MNGGPAERSEFVRSVSIEVDGYRRALNFMEGLLERSRRSNYPGGLWILAKGGQGKSFILESFIRQHSPVEKIEGLLCEVLLISFPSRPSESDILLKILFTLGQNPESLKYKRNADLQTTVEKAMAHCGVRVILFDEAQHFWLSASGKTSRAEDRLGGSLGDFLKRLYDNTGVAYVFAGTPGLQALIDRDEQASTRWPGLVCLEQFANDEKFRGILDAIDEALPMEARSGLAEEPLKGKIHEASDGNFRRLKSFLSEAVFVAAEEGEKAVENRHFVQAYFKIFGNPETPFGRCAV